MRLGCGGCLGALLALALAVTALGGLIWGIQQAGAPPEPVRAAGLEDDAEAEREARVRAERKLVELVARRGRGPRTPVFLSEAELEALLAARLGELGDLPIAAVALRLPGEGVVDLAVSLPLRVLLAETLPRAALGVLPEAWVGRPVWLRLRGRPQVEPGGGGRRYLRLTVDRAGVGRLPLPAFAPRLLLPPSALRLLRWPIPDALEEFRVEAGRVSLWPRGSSP